MYRKIFKNLDWSILVCCFILVGIGLIALASATQNSDYSEFIKQTKWLSIAIVLCIFVICFNYKNIAKFSPIIYVVFIALLIGVLFTEPINGASSWYDLGFFQFQPAEFAKIFFVIFLAYIIIKLQNRDKKEINKIWKLSVVLLITAIPVLLIIKQPDYGTACAFLFALFFMLFVAGIKKKYILITFLLIVIILPLAYFYILPEHAKSRIDVFLNPNLDPRGAGYNIIQSKLAIGAGELFGMGFSKGNQTQLGFLYPKTTDFIFSVIGEEFGFIATCVIVIVYVMLIVNAIRIAKTASDDLGSYISIGIAGIFSFHMIENIGMTIGLLPITGVPLPFVSYGGSSLITSFILVGLLLNINARKNDNMFMER